MCLGFAQLTMCQKQLEIKECRWALQPSALVSQFLKNDHILSLEICRHHGCLPEEHYQKVQQGKSPGDHLYTFI